MDVLFASAPPLADVSRPSHSKSTWRGCSLAKASRGPRTRPGRRSRSRSGHTRWPMRVAMGATGSTCATARTARYCVRQRPPRGRQRWRQPAACSPTTGVRPKSSIRPPAAAVLKARRRCGPLQTIPIFRPPKTMCTERIRRGPSSCHCARCSRPCVVPASMVSGSGASRSRSAVRPGA